MSPRTEVSTREASDPPDEHPISGNGGWPEVYTVRRTAEADWVKRRRRRTRPRDLVHILYAYRCRRRGVNGDDQTWSSILPIIFDVLYREFCRARLAEMRKQLLLWPGTPVVPEENCEAGHPDDAADRGIGLGSSQEWDSHAEGSHS